jgi:hypothetical protein
MTSSCSLAVPFLEQFVLMMVLPPTLFLAVLVAFFISKCCLKSKVGKKKRGNELKYQMILLMILFLYPGLATKIFTVFRCKQIEGIDGEVLAADFSITCYETEHSLYLVVAGASLGLYILGIPLVMFLVLWRNRDYLHVSGEEEPTNKHKAIRAQLGGLYLQYEPKYWVSTIF